MLTPDGRVVGVGLSWARKSLENVMDAAESTHEEPKGFGITVIATSAKKVAARPREPIGQLKLAALTAFGIPEEKATEYRLASAPGDPGAEFDDNKLVVEYHLHAGSKVYLVKPHNDA